MSGEQVQEFSAACEAECWLREKTALPASQRQSLAELIPRLLKQINRDRKTTIGISGAPGSGKSTLARLLVHCLNRQGTPACRLSLDDYYLGRAQRELLAGKVHPLLRQRGVPGTHEFDRLLADLDLVRKGEPGSMQVPVFDKSIDDRAPQKHWRLIETDPVVTVLEGWCLGVPPQPVASMLNPVNDLEQQQDPDGVWRHETLKAWQRYYLALKGRLDQLWYIRVPDWNCVVDWRWQQEQELPQWNLEGRLEVGKFLAGFERIVNYMQDSHAQWADLVMEADRHHGISLQNKIGNST